MSDFEVCPIGTVARLAAVEAERDALIFLLRKAVENGCMTSYANEHDEVGSKGCCGELSFEPHAADCWLAEAKDYFTKLGGGNG